MKNWKTTVLGLVAGFLNLYASGMNPKAAAVSVALAAFGMVAKDSNVTGGTVQQ